MAQKKKKAKFRRPKFGLKFTLILFSLTSLLLALFAGSLNEARLESRFLERLDEFCERNNIRAQYRYDYEFEKQRILMRSSRKPYGPGWVRSIFGQHIFSRIRELQLSGSPNSLPKLSEENFLKEFKTLNLSTLKELKRIKLEGLSEIKDLSLISDQRNLEHLRIMDCRSLSSFDGIENLKRLRSIVGPIFFTRLHDAKALKDLDNLEIINLNVKDEFATTRNWDALASKPNLLELTVDKEGTPTMPASSSFVPSPNLENLAFEHVDPGLKDLRSFAAMPRLQGLRIIGSPTLTSLKGIEKCQYLTHLVVHDCPNLESLEGIEQLQNLSLLSISSSQPLSIPELQCRDLKALGLREVHGFADLTFLKNVENLRSIDVTRSGLKTLKGIGHLALLEDIRVGGSDIEAVACEKAMVPLRRLDFSRCEKLKDLHGIENFQQVETILLRGCSRLDQLNGLGQLSSLVHLDLSGCTAIESLADLRSVFSLEHVIVNRCSNLSDVSALLNIEQLRLFEWHDCLKLNADDVESLRKKFDRLQIRSGQPGPSRWRAVESYQQL